MKIIQTLYIANTTRPLDSAMGFASPELNWMSWALSCLRLRQYYSDVHLYTNEPGYDVLIRKLDLPYTQVHILEDLSFPDQLWAYPKIKTYSLQREPFLHVDGDVFIWKKLDDQLLAQPLIAQNLETHCASYNSMVGRLQQHQVILPGAITLQLQSPHPLSACNAGLLGGHDLDFFQHYTHSIFRFLEVNHHLWPLLNRAEVNMLYEQVLFHAQATQQQKNISYYHPLPVSDMTYPGFAEFSGVPHTTSFIHLMGAFKRDPYICLMLVRRLRQSYPKYYERILKICKQENISTSFNYHSEKKRQPVVGTTEVYWANLLRQEKRQCNVMDTTFGLPNLSATRFRITPHLKFREERRQDGGTSVCYVACGLRRSWIPVPCDDLDHLLIDTLRCTRSFQEIVEKIAPHFDNTPQDHHALQRLLTLRLRRGCDHNLFRIVTRKQQSTLKP